ncbi:MAG: hypothetical protein IPM53_17510 [Anaerolineaceae bacterium]|nr:hypothetical protein [Anaerolineaceae bacterium]
MKLKIIVFICFTFFLAGLLSVAAWPVQAEPAALTLNVNNSLVDAVDANPGDGVCETAVNNNVCTLRAAVMEANAWPGADTILIPAGTYYLGLVATSFENNALNGDLDLTDDVTIIGADEAATIIDGNRSASKARVFEIFEGVTVAMSHLTIRNGMNEPGPGIAGGIQNVKGSVSLTHVTLTDNSRGGLYNNGGTAVLDFVTYTNNFDNGASLYNSGGGTMIVRNSVIAGNQQNGGGGGVWTEIGNLTMINTTVSGNGGPDTSHGGGIFVANGTATLINSTISANQTTASGGGVYVFQSTANYPATLNLYNVTIANNTANTSGGNYTGGGIYVDTIYGFTPTVNVHNSIIADNWLESIGGDDSDCYGPINSGGYNLIRTTTGCVINGVTTGNQYGVDPLLGHLANGGGFGKTHTLKDGSPAIDAGNPLGCTDNLGALLLTDQRSYVRHVDGGSGAPRCDIGAYEYNAIPYDPPDYQVYLPYIQK